ncbi:MAG: cupredoxin domain-containing protein [Actinomycetota bacterium]
MLRRRLPALCALFLVTAACGGPDIDVRVQEPEGPTWFTQVVEFEQNSGPGLSISTDAQGNPHLAYLELTEPPPPGEDPPPIDPLAPVLPAVGHAHLTGDIWTHSEVVQGQAKTPTDAEKLRKLTPEDETAIAVDPEGTHHIVWTEGGKLLYSNDPTGEARPEVVAAVDATGLSIWADEAGIPWIAYYEVQSDPEGPGALVRVATIQGNGWSLETAAEADASEPYSTGIGPGPDGPVVGYGGATGTNVTSRRGNSWNSETVDPDGGIGVSMDLDADGNPHLAYVTSEGQVRHAHSIGGGPWEISDVGAATAPGVTSIAVDDQGVHHIAWQRDVDLAYATNAGGKFAEVPLPASSLGGQRPRVAAGPAGVNLAWYSPVGTRLNMATYSEDEPLLAVPSPSAPPGGGAAPAACQPEGDVLSIAAQGLAFDKDCLAVEAGAPFSIDFDNQEAVQHNVAIYTEEGGDPLFQGEVIMGPTTTTYEPDPIDEPGDLHFQCDIHPTTMTGTFVIAGK